MRRYSIPFLVLLLLIGLSLPITLVDSLRSATAGVVSPLFRHLEQVKAWGIKLTTVWPTGGYNTDPATVKELEILKLDNYHLRSQLELLQGQLGLTRTLQSLRESHDQLSSTDDSSYRRRQELLRQLELYGHAITARVIFRDSASWNSSCWINIGRATNEQLQFTLVAPNSPVVIGTTVVGVVEFVGERRSRVRLVTDPSLVLSVRALRTTPETGSLYLAKGLLQGSIPSYGRLRSTLLQGDGFNYDFEDAEGKAPPSIPLIQPHDLIITTGMDGIMPPRLLIGKVRTVTPPRPGSSCYQAEIQSFITSFETLSFVTVLPPLAEND